ncbi:DUF3048 domain-containing protein [Patescibacteria group bacterium]
MTKKHKITLISAGIIVLACLILGGVLFFVLSNDSKGTAWQYPLNPYNLFKDKNVAKDLVACKLCGEKVNKKIANQYPVGVMIDNHTSARPAINLIDACVVYETLVEGGITRIMAVYADGKIDQIGPVRSARPYYLDWVSEYDGLYVHAGGSPRALELIYTYGILDMNHSENAFFRDLKGGYIAPHNLFVEIDKIRKNGKNKYELKDEIRQRFKFKKETPTDSDFINSISIDYSNYADFSVRFDYDPNNNSYLRYLGGQADLDGLSKQQIEVKNLVVQISPTWMEGDGSARIDMQTQGSGNAYVFRDGKMINATWAKIDRESKTIYSDSSGKEIKMNRGMTWISVVSDGSTLNYE